MDVFSICKKTAAEGTVLLKNDNKLLPLKAKTKLAVFGRIQTNYYRCGTGSGGGVHISENPVIIDSLKKNNDLIIDSDLEKIYADWVAEHPFDDGGGVWAGEPWCQEEMPLTDEIVKTVCIKNDAALVIIGRTAGEDHDNANEKGSYLLTDLEEDMLKKVCENFEKVIVVLNVGNIIDLSFLDRYKITSLLYIWHGGMAGADALANILTGALTPSGKLCDTQAFDIKDYPSNDNFGDKNKNIYKEDIYVGYRYFETFAKEKVRFPFGFGLSYTNFNLRYSAGKNNDIITVNAECKNIGIYSGKEVVEVYYEAPCGKLGTPSRQLITYSKTNDLKPNETESIKLCFSISQMASYDDSGITGNKSCYVLESGDYNIYVGTDVRNAECVLTVNIPETTVTEKLTEILPPRERFERIVAKQINGSRILEYMPTPEYIEKKSKRAVAEEIAFTGDRGIKLKDVRNKKNTLNEFVSQLTDEELACLVCGEGMSSPKSTAGAGGSIGGTTEELSYYGIPVCPVTDGPSGVNLAGTKTASLVPIGTLLACSFNNDLICELFTFIGEELRAYEVDALLGPGVNIHRNPLCGRNFEYFSEDPVLSGNIAAYITMGIAKSGSYSTIKHFCCNNQETARHMYDSVVSERALREIYLKPFEIAVKKGKNVLVMTSYNMVNGFYAASSYDLTTTVLRDEWGFDNIVMTDWWANCNLEYNGAGNKNDIWAMVKAQNDTYMVCSDSRVKSSGVIKGLKNGDITRGELQRNVINILKWILKTNTYKDCISKGINNKYPVSIDFDSLKELQTIENPKRDTDYEIAVAGGKKIAVSIVLSSSLDELAQSVIFVKVDSVEYSFIINGTNGKTTKVDRFVTTDWIKTHSIKVKSPENVSVISIKIFN